LRFDDRINYKNLKDTLGVLIDKVGLALLALALVEQNIIINDY